METAPLCLQIAASISAASRTGSNMVRAYLSSRTALRCLACGRMETRYPLSTVLMFMRKKEMKNQSRLSKKAELRLRRKQIQKNRSNRNPSQLIKSQKM